MFKDRCFKVFIIYFIIIMYLKCIQYCTDLVLLRSNKGRAKARHALSVCTVFLSVCAGVFPKNSSALSQTVATMALMTVQCKGPWKEYQSNLSLYYSASKVQ